MDDWAENTAVLSVLNGVDIAERLRSIIPWGAVLSGCVYISAFIEAPASSARRDLPARLRP